MSFADSDDIDDEANSTEDVDETVDNEEADSSLDNEGTEDGLEGEAYLVWADDWAIHDDPELPIREAVEENARVLRNTTNDLWNDATEAITQLQEEVEDLREENEQLREDNEQLRERLDSLEGWKGNAVRSVNENTHDLSRLAAAVFDKEPPCPECEDGHLEADTGGFGSDAIACTDCEYEEELA